MLPNPLVICVKELTEITRDRRSLLQPFLVLSISCPVIAYFLLIFGKQMASDLWIIWCQFFASVPLFLNVPIGTSLTTGEKERKMMETTLTLCVSRRDLIFGKYITIMLTNFILAGFMFLCAVIACFATSYFFPSKAPSFSDQMFLKLAICYCTYSTVYIIYFSAMILTVGLFARNTKEATGLSNALFLIVAALPVLGTVLKLKLTHLTIFLPIVNCNLVCGQFMNASVAWYYWLLMFGTILLCTLIPIRYAITLINKDAMLASS